MTDAETIAATAQFAIAAGDWPAAATAFEQLAACYDLTPAAIAYNAGAAHRRAGDLDAALRWFDRALAADPNHLSAIYERAAACMDAGHHRDALAGFEAYLDIVPDDRDAALNRARLLVSLGHWDDAEVAWATLADASTADGSREARLARLTILAETGRHQVLLDDARALLTADRTAGAEIIRHLTHAGRGMIPLRATVLVSPIEVSREATTCT